MKVLMRPQASTLTVVMPNEAPEVLNEMAMIEAIEDAPLAFVIPTEGEAAIFTDADLETQILERLEYSAFLGEGENWNPLNEQESWLKIRLRNLYVFRDANQ